MSDAIELRPPIQWFAEQMEHKITSCFDRKFSEGVVKTRKKSERQIMVAVDGGISIYISLWRN